MGAEVARNKVTWSNHGIGKKSWLNRTLKKLQERLLVNKTCPVDPRIGDAEARKLSEKKNRASIETLADCALNYWERPGKNSAISAWKVAATSISGVMPIGVRRISHAEPAVYSRRERRPILPLENPLSSLDENEKKEEGSG